MQGAIPWSPYKATKLLHSLAHRAAEMSAKWRLRKSCYLNSSFIVDYKWKGFTWPA